MSFGRRTTRVRTLQWNGRDLPEELSSDEDAGLERGIASLRAGDGRSLAQVRQTIDAILGK